MDKILCSLLCLFFLIGIIILIKNYFTKKESFHEEMFDLKQSFCKYYKEDALKLRELCPKFKQYDCDDCCVWSNNQCVVGNARYGPIKFNSQ